VSALSTCSTSRQSFTTTASTFFSALLLRCDDDSGGDARGCPHAPACRRFVEEGEGSAPQPVPVQWSARRRRCSLVVVQQREKICNAVDVLERCCSRLILPSGSHHRFPHFTDVEGWSPRDSLTIKDREIYTVQPSTSSVSLFLLIAFISLQRGIVK
jgi:hypothetical protein